MSVGWCVTKKLGFVSIIYFGATTLSLMTLIIMTFSIKTLSLKTFSITKKCDTQHNGTTFKCWVSFKLSFTHAECHIQALYAEWHYALSCYAWSCYAEFRSCWESHKCLVCLVELCRILLCWVLLCWVSYMLSVTYKLFMLSGIMVSCYTGYCFLSFNHAESHVQALNAEWYYAVSSYDWSCYAEFKSCWLSHTSPLCWVVLCRDLWY